MPRVPELAVDDRQPAGAPVDERDQLHEIVASIVRDEPPHQPLLHRNRGLLEGHGVGPPEFADRVPEHAPVLVRGPRCCAEVLPHVDRQNLGEEHPEQLFDAVSAHQIHGRPLRVHPFVQVVEVLSPLGRGTSGGTDGPVVDHLREDVEPRGREEGKRQRRLILVPGSLREGDTGALPEGPSKDLVPHEDVGQHQRLVLDSDPQPLDPVIAPHQGRDEATLTVEALRTADREVRAGLSQRAHHRGPGVCGQLVVRVDEREVLPGAATDRVVAGDRDPRVLLPEVLHPRVPSGVVGGDVTGAVGRTVIDHHHLHIGDGLAQDAVQAGRQPRGDVEHRHHDTQLGVATGVPPRPTHAAESRPGEMRAWTQRLMGPPDPSRSVGGGHEHPRRCA